MSYTYKLEWVLDGEKFHYYGVRYSKNCCPSELGDTYLSSSLEVKRFIEERGYPDVIEVDCIFENASDAVEYEAKILSENNAAQNPNWLNKTNGHKNFFVTTETAAKSGLSQRGKKLSIDHKDKIRKSVTETWTSPELRAAQSLKIRGRKDTPETIARKKNAQGSPEGRLRNRNINLGKRRSPAQIENYRAAARIRNADEDIRAKIGASVSLAWCKKPMIECPHCGMKGKKGRNMTMYHFDNCKSRNAHLSEEI